MNKQLSKPLLGLTLLLLATLPASAQKNGGVILEDYLLLGA